MTASIVYFLRSVCVKKVFLFVFMYITVKSKHNEFVHTKLMRDVFIGRHVTSIMWHLEEFSEVCSAKNPQRDGNTVQVMSEF